MLALLQLRRRQLLQVQAYMLLAAQYACAPCRVLHTTHVLHMHAASHGDVVPEALWQFAEVLELVAYSSQ
jgi:hypothetical protein